MIFVEYSLKMLQEIELFEASYYGLVRRVNYLLTTGVNVNMTSFVSGIPDIHSVRCATGLASPSIYQHCMCRKNIV